MRCIYDCVNASFPIIFQLSLFIVGNVIFFVFWEIIRNTKIGELFFKAVATPTSVKNILCQVNTPILKLGQCKARLHALHFAISISKGI